MVREDNLTSVLTEFARTLVTDFPIQLILDHFVRRIVGVLPVTGVGVTLSSPRTTPYYMAASDEAALAFELLQTELGQGPGLIAYDTGDLVAAPDLAGDDRFPLFGPVAVAAGIAAIFTFPLRHGDEQLGALGLYRNIPGMLTATDMAAAQTLADVAAAYILNAQAREQALEAIVHFRDAALHDPLTGLANRSLLHQRFEHAAARARRSHSAAAVLFVDLDRFKQVNDEHGHAVGDHTLVSVADRLSSLIRPGDTLARVSGDEFLILCEEIAHSDAAEALAERIADAFAPPFAIGALQLDVTASVGIAYCGAGEHLSDDLVIRADIAMYQAKRRGGASYHILDLREANELKDYDRLGRDLRAAMSSDGLDLAYQPIVRTTDGLVTGVEALLRWTHPTRGPISALTAITLAERTGLIAELGTWVLRRACEDRMRWLADYPERPLGLSVNVSARQLMGGGFRDTVAHVVDATRMDPTALILELTEGIFIEDGDRAMSVLNHLKELGLRIALDDFGTEYSSLNYLRRFPVDILKIDQSFVAGLGKDPVDSAIVAAVTHLARALRVTVTAEGVETDNQRNQVLSLGCELAQGYFFARPVVESQIREYLASSPGQPLRIPPRTPPHAPPAALVAESAGSQISLAS